MTYKLYLGQVLSVGGSKLECLGKRVLKFKVFFSGLMSVRLSVRQVHFWTQLAWANRERTQM